MKKYLVLYNPLSARGTGCTDARRIERIVQDAEVTYQDTTHIKDYPAYFRTVPQDTDIVFTGGDGTINWMANEVYGCLERDLFYFPAGSGNDFINDIGRDKLKKLTRMNDYFEHLPLVRVNGVERRFVNGIGFGLDGYCCEESDRLKAMGRRKSYGRIALEGVIKNYKPINVTVTVDGVTKSYRDVWMAPTMFGRFYGGGFNMASMQDRKNAEHTVTSVAIYGVGRLSAMPRFPLVMLGYGHKLKKYTAYQKGHHVIVESDRPMALQIDGETVLNVTRYEVETDC